jgi:hypothetical protein
MAWTNSKIFTAFIENALENVSAYALASDTIKVALYNNTPVPDQTVSQANTAYNVGQWVNTSEVADAAEWAAGGQALDTVTSAFSSNVYKFDADDEVSAGSSATLANVYGCLVYDSTISSYGLCYLYFGGANSVTDGTFTVVFNSSGIFTLTL